MKTNAVYFLVVILLTFAINAFSTEWSPIKQPDLKGKLGRYYEKFWDSIKVADFDGTIKIAQALKNLKPDNDYVVIIDNITELLTKYKSNTEGKILSSFLMLEKKRIYWQDFNWWPEDKIYVKATKQINAIVKEFEELLKTASNSDLEAEILYRLGLCYSDNGPLGFKEYNKAVEVLKVIERKYSQNNLADDAAFEIILIKIKASQENNKPKISIEAITLMLKDFIAKYPEGNRKIEAQKLIGNYYEFQGNYQLAAEEYSKLVEQLGKTKLTLELLDNLSFIYRSKAIDKVKEKNILEQILRDFPNSYSASYAKARLEEIKEGL